MQKKFDPQLLLRGHIRKLKPYSSARDEFAGKASVYLDANENPFSSSNATPYPTNFNRYPDPHQLKLKEKIAKLKNVSRKNIFLGNGSDEAIDLLLRAFCIPGEDSIIICPPTYGMYQVFAQIHDLIIHDVPLLEPDFEPDVEKILSLQSDRSKILFLCSPNNPTGNLLNPLLVEKILNNFNGIVVLDEAYLDFSGHLGFVSHLDSFPNLVVLQTFSKAWGLAGLRLGMAFASEEIIQILEGIKSPYNIGTVGQELGLKALEHPALIIKWCKILIQERTRMHSFLSEIKQIQKVFPSDANFLLLKVAEPRNLYVYLSQIGIVVRDRSHLLNCSGCLRITIGTREENDILLKSLNNYWK